MKTFLLLLGSLLVSHQGRADNQVVCTKSKKIDGDRVTLSWIVDKDFSAVGIYTVAIGAEKFELVSSRLGFKKTSRKDYPSLLVRESGMWVDRSRVFLKLLPTAGSKFGLIQIEVPDMGKEGGATVKVYASGKTRKTRVLCRFEET